MATRWHRWRLRLVVPDLVPAVNHDLAAQRLLATKPDPEELFVDPAVAGRVSSGRCTRHPALGSESPNSGQRASSTALASAIALVIWTCSGVMFGSCCNGPRPPRADQRSRITQGCRLMPVLPSRWATTLHPAAGPLPSGW